MKLNLGSGQRQMEGYINLDKEDYGQEIIRDVTRGLPFEDNKFDEVYTAHFMEHIRNGKDLYFVLSEVYRVCMPGAKFIIITPHSSNQEAFFPDHLSYWNEKVIETIVNDADFSQRQKEYIYKFKILELDHIIYELRTILEVIK
jgi:predicted SAM-dependent methyltransferase